MDQNLRLFLNATKLDLEAERSALETVLHELRDTAFAGLAYHAADAGAPTTADLAGLDTCDVYIGLIAHRYGSGFIETAYRRARQRDIPYLIYLKEENAAPASSLAGEDPQQHSKLAAFKAELKERGAVSYFETPEQLAALARANLRPLLSEIKKRKNASPESARSPATYIVSGDLILGDKTGGDKFTVDNISNSNVAVGESSSVSAVTGGSGPVHDSGYGGQDPEIAELHTLLVKQFDLEELQNLCFDLGVDYDEIKGTGKYAKARELVLFMQRRGQLDRLRQAIHSARG